MNASTTCTRPNARPDLETLLDTANGETVMTQKPKRIVIGLIVLVTFASSCALVGPAAASRVETGPERLQRSPKPEGLPAPTIAPRAAGTPTPAQSSIVVYTSDGNPCARPLPDRGGGGGESPYPELTAGRAVQLKLEGHPGPVEFAGFSSDGKKIVTSGGGLIRLWDAATGRKLLTLSTNRMLRSPTFSPDGQTIAVAADDGTVRLYNTATGGEKLVLRDAAEGADTFGAIPRGFRSVAFSPDGRTIATTKREVAMLWDAMTGRKLRELAGKPAVWADDPSGGIAFGHASSIYSVVFSPNGQALLTAGDDWTVRLWDVATGKHLRCFEPLEGEVSSRFTSATFSPDGRTIVASYADKQFGWLGRHLSVECLERADHPDLPGAPRPPRRQLRLLSVPRAGPSYLPARTGPHACGTYVPAS